MFFFFFFNDTAPTEIYTLSLHDALPISVLGSAPRCMTTWAEITLTPLVIVQTWRSWMSSTPDRKSTRLNSSHANISYAVFCLKKKKKGTQGQYGSLYQEDEQHQHDGAIT